MSQDLTTRDGVRDLMELSRNSAEWNSNCDRVKAANARNGRPDYPSFWYEVVLASGLNRRVAASWGDPTALDLKIKAIG